MRHHSLLEIFFFKLTINKPLKSSNVLSGIRYPITLIRPKFGRYLLRKVDV